ncbi:ROK family protein [candidate division KSB1 bacterium]|nr:ROK family protein [candidate division KSB1 bacterium]
MEALGIDVGGSGIKGAIINIDAGELMGERYRIPTPDPSTPNAVAETIKQIVHHFNWSGKMGVGFPAAIQHGEVRTAANIDPSWIGVDAVTLLTKKTGCQTRVLNDADAAAIAEMEFGGGRDNKGVVFIITIGTGIGTAVFTNGRLLPNTELGHIFLKNGREAEPYASDAVRKSKNLSWKKWAKRFNKYLNEIERLFWPDLIIIGGGASKKDEKYFSHLVTKAPIVPASLLNEAGIIGAAVATKYME